MEAKTKAVRCFHRNGYISDISGVLQPFYQQPVNSVAGEMPAVKIRQASRPETGAQKRAESCWKGGWCGVWGGQAQSQTASWSDRKLTLCYQCLLWAKHVVRLINHTIWKKSHKDMDNIVNSEVRAVMLVICYIFFLKSSPQVLRQGKTSRPHEFFCSVSPGWKINEPKQI